MSTQPRRRRPTSPPPPSGGGGWIGTAVIALGVAVAGLGIGVLLAAYQQRSKTPDTSTIATATQAPTLAPIPKASRLPIAIATIVPRHTPRPSPTPSPSVAPSPSATPSAAPTATATAKPTVKPSATPSAVPTHAPTPAPTITPAQHATVKPLSETAAPRRSPPPVPPTITPAIVARATAIPTPMPVATIAPPTPPVSAMAAAASGVVRRYIDALVRGDESTGYTLLGGSGNGATLSEESFLDPSAHITALRAKRIDDSNASVEVDITSAKGSYSANYRVTAGPRGPYITQHDFIKV